jgi:predicted RNase H-like HicB family nuclease
MNKPRFEDFRFEIRPLSAEDGGGLMISFPDLPGCFSDGDTYEEVIANGRETFYEWVEGWQEMGRKVPHPSADDDIDPSKFVVRMPHSLHLRMMATAAAEGVSANMLLTTIIAEGVAVRAPRKSIAEPKARYRVKKAARPARQQKKAARGPLN